MRPGATQERNTPSLPETTLERLGVPLAGAQLQALESFSALVARWNRVAGLVSRDDLNRFSHRHLLDSLVLAPLLREREGADAAPGGADAEDTDASLPVADFGSGAGLPGVPLAIALPGLTFTLIDRSEKKARFLRRVRDELKLPNVRVLCADVRQLQRCSCRAVVARATMPVQALWPHARAALAPGGCLLVLDRIVRSAEAPPVETPGGCDGATIRRHWTQMPQFGAWHGVLEVREMHP
ncbi:MAG: 16S rRNA (guanine(527)-N(7))-methyltransferase RsmG [Gammaproteobacteria bacterium]|nr:16S rRNA (guanine(527)-N(7))-methyltransferase RsmG [Gammaproteobacteria bacterium]